MLKTCEDRKLLTDQICKSSMYHLWKQFRIRKYLEENSACTLIHGFKDFITTQKAKKPQQIQNIAACFVTVAQKYNHIRFALTQLHWLPVSHRIVFNQLIFVKGLCPHYLAELVIHRKSTRSLRSSYQDLLNVLLFNRKLRNLPFDIFIKTDSLGSFSLFLVFFSSLGF